MILRCNPHYKLTVPTLGTEIHECVLLDKLVKESKFIDPDTPFAVVRAGKFTFKLRSKVPGHLDWLSECGQTLKIGENIARVGIYGDEPPYASPYVSAEKVRQE